MKTLSTDSVDREAEWTKSSGTKKTAKIMLEDTRLQSGQVGAVD